MASFSSECGDRPWTRRQARVMLALFLLVAAFFVAITFSPLASGFADAPLRGPGDIDLYRGEVERIRAGTSYYDAVAVELHERGYPTKSVFNWRTPLPVWLVAALPELAMANIALSTIGFLLVLASFCLLADEAGPNLALAGVLLLSGALLPCMLGELVLSAELWSGVLMALSAVCIGLKRSATGVAAGVASLFFRELAAPYCLLCIVLAAQERRHRELALWGAGLAAYAAFYAWHVAQVLPRIAPEAIAHQEGWIRFGGAGFLISTVQMNAYLLLLPQWVTGVYLALALLGAATWNTPAGRLIGWTVALYAIAFSIVGHDFNQYWGSQIAPLLCLPVARSLGVLGQLRRAALGNSLSGECPACR